MAKRWYVVHAYSSSRRACSAPCWSASSAPACRPVRPDPGAGGRSGRAEDRGQKSITERKFFPGYVLVEMDMNDETWHLVKNTPKVTGFVGGSAKKPTPIVRRKSRRSCSRCRRVSKSRVQGVFEVGELVRVKEGPFTDFNGMVEEVNYEKSKLRVAVTIFGRATPVELDFGQVEKA